MTRRRSVAILGAGAGGIAMGIALEREGYEYTIYEKSDGVGGTWRDNTYPGAACDVPSHLYSYSFEPNPNWSKTYATQPEILAYLEGCAEKYGILPHLRTGTAITTAEWDDARQQWTLTAESGQTFTADVLVSGLGMLNVPFVPEIRGAESFTGRMFHTSRWDHGKPLTGERVASIGTGASAIQYVPAIAAEVEHLSVFQRSPIWVSPRLDSPYSPEQQATFARKPWTARRHRWQIWWSYQRSSFQVESEMTAMQTGLAQSYLHRKIEDPELRAMLTPDFPVGCKRPLFSRDWFPALTRPNVCLVASPITSVSETAVHTADGRTHEVDTIIFGTGFKANEYLTSVDVIGRGGRRLHDDWSEGAEAYLGLSTTGYPNFFMLYGPNTNGVNSILFILEAQVHYVMKALRAMRRRGLGVIEIKEPVQRQYNEKVQAGMKGTVWLAGCTNYFTAPNGKVITQLPYSAGEYWLRTRILGVWRYRRQRRRRSTIIDAEGTTPYDRSASRV